MATVTRTYQQTLFANYNAAIQAYAQGVNGSYLTPGGDIIPMRQGPRMVALAVGGGVFSVAINAAGSGYQVGDILTSTVVTLMLAVVKLRVTSVNPGSGAITGIQVLSPGFGVGIAPLSGGGIGIPSFSGGHGTLATFTLTNQGSQSPAVTPPYGYPQPAA